jgi:hypothetical protein
MAMASWTTRAGAMDPLGRYTDITPSVMSVMERARFVVKVFGALAGLVLLFWMARNREEPFAECFCEDDSDHDDVDDDDPGEDVDDWY